MSPVPGRACRHIGEEVSERLEYVPASFVCDRGSLSEIRLRQGAARWSPAQKPMQPDREGSAGTGVAGATLPRQQSMAIIFRCTVRKGFTSAKEWPYPAKTMCDWMPAVRRACPSAFRADERAGSRVQKPCRRTTHRWRFWDPALSAHAHGEDLDLCRG